MVLGAVRFVIAVLVLGFASGALSARSWSDLDEGEQEIYGREREQKLPIRLFFVQREHWDNHDALHIFWLFAYKDYPRYKSNRLLPFYYQLTSKIDNRYYFISPVYSQEIDGDSRDESLLWLYYWGRREGAQKQYTGLVPLYYQSTYAGKNPFILSLLFWYSAHPAAEGQEKGYTSFGAPIIPLVIWNSSPAKTDLFLFYLARFRNRQEDSLSFVLPLFYSDRRKDGTDSIFLSPVYASRVRPGEHWGSLFWIIQWGGSDKTARSAHSFFPLYSWESEGEDTDLDILLLFRHRHTQDSLLTYALPLYYYQRDKDAMLASFLIPLLWHWSNPKESSWIIIPLFYSVSTEHETTRISPVYISLVDSNSNFKLFIPFYFDYERDGYFLHVNATGISLSEETLSLSPISAQVNHERIIADWDFGWFYNLFRVSSRHTVHLAPKPPPEVPIDNPSAEPIEDDDLETPAANITAKRERTRADSEKFFGLYLLFGASAYERADHYRHFRLLPLSWLTWNVNSEHGVQTVIPFYVHYQDEDTRYLVLFPVYGTQEKKHEECSSFTTAWVLITYWNEYSCETQTSEQTVIWPIYNHYEAPDHGGYRIFPVFWHKWRKSNGVLTKYHFSPFHYTSTRDETYLTLSWLFYREVTKTDSTFGIWALYHRSSAHDGSSAMTYALPVFYWFNTRENKVGGTEQKQRRTESLFSFAAIYWRYADSSEPKSEDHYLFEISPLHMRIASPGRTAFYSWLFYSSNGPSHTAYGVPLLLHRYADHDGTYQNFYLFPFYHSSQKNSEQPNAEADSVYILFPLYYSHTRPGLTRRFALGYYNEQTDQSRTDSIPLVVGITRDHAQGSSSWNALLYTFWYNNERDETRFRLFYGLVFNYKATENIFSWHFSLITGYRSERDNGYRRHHFLPLWWNSTEGKESHLYLPFLLSAFTSHDDGNRVFRAVALGTLYYQKTDVPAYDQTLAVAMGTIYYHNRNRKTEGREYDSYGSLFGLLWHYESEGSYNRFALLAFVFIRSEDENGVRRKLLGFIPF
jgi:hypothetical protein